MFYLPVDEGSREAREAVERALALDVNLAEAHTALVQIKMFQDWDWTGMDAESKRALALDPGNSDVLVQAAGATMTLGRFEEALPLFRRALEIDPLNVLTWWYLGYTYLSADRLEEAEAAYKKAVELNPQFQWAHNHLGVVYLLQGRPEVALAEMERETQHSLRLQGLGLAYHRLGKRKEADAALRDLIEEFATGAAFQIAEVYAFRGEDDRAFEWLERAYVQRDAGLAWTKISPLLKNLERDSRYAAFLKKMRLPL